MGFVALRARHKTLPLPDSNEAGIAAALQDGRDADGIWTGIPPREVEGWGEGTGRSRHARVATEGGRGQRRMNAPPALNQPF